MKSLPFRTYADTSVFGGTFDEEFKVASRVFFDQVRSGRFQLVISAVVQAEIKGAPLMVRELFDEMLGLSERTLTSREALDLQEAYMKAGIVSPKWRVDALHVALASVVGCSLIVSWNFKHIVHFEKIPLYNAVNTLNGYAGIRIFSPQEVIAYEENI